MSTAYSHDYCPLQRSFSWYLSSHFYHPLQTSQVDVWPLHYLWEERRRKICASQILFQQTGFSWTLKAITDERCAFGVDDSTWEKVEVILFAIHNHCVSCIVSTLLMKQEIHLNHTFRFLPRIKNEVDKTTSDTFTREAAVSHSSLKPLFFSSTYFLNRTWLPLVCPRLRFGLLTYQAPQRMWPLTSTGEGLSGLQITRCQAHQ